MNIQNKVARIALTHSKWIRPALMMMAVVVAVLGLTGCGHSH